MVRLKQQLMQAAVFCFALFSCQFKTSATLYPSIRMNVKES